MHTILPCTHLCTQTGGVRETAPGEDKQDVINEAGKQEIALTLVNRAEGLAQEDSSNMKALFVRYSGLYRDIPGIYTSNSLLHSLFYCMHVCVDVPASDENEPGFLPVYIHEKLH